MWFIRTWGEWVSRCQPEASRTHRVERLGQVLCTAAVRNVAVDGVVLEELLLLDARVLHGQVEVDILL
jgi:hypothetical protein